MAFTTEQKHQIIFALYLPGSILDSSSMLYNSIVNDRLNDLNVAVENKALDLVDNIELAKEKLNTSASKNAVKSIGDIHFMDNGIRSSYQAELKRLTKELSLLLDIPIGKMSGNMVSVCL